MTRQVDTRVKNESILCEQEINIGGTEDDFLTT